MTIVERLNNLIKQHGMNAAEACRALDISSTSFTDWKNERSKPSLDTVVKFADYFHLSLDWIVRGKEFEPDSSSLPIDSFDNLSIRERKCISKFHKLPPEYQDKLLSYIDGMIAVLPDDEEVEKKIG